MDTLRVPSRKRPDVWIIVFIFLASGIACQSGPGAALAADPRQERAGPESAEGIQRFQSLSTITEAVSNWYLSHGSLPTQEQIQRKLDSAPADQRPVRGDTFTWVRLNKLPATGITESESTLRVTIRNRLGVVAEAADMPFFPMDEKTWYPKYLRDQAGEQLICTDRNLCDYVATAVWDYHDRTEIWPKSLRQTDVFYDLDKGPAYKELKHLIVSNLLVLKGTKDAGIVLSLNGHLYIYPSCGPDEKNAVVKVTRIKELRNRA